MILVWSFKSIIVNRYSTYIHQTVGGKNIICVWLRIRVYRYIVTPYFRSLISFIKQIQERLKMYIIKEACKWRFLKSFKTEVLINVYSQNYNFEADDANIRIIVRFCTNFQTAWVVLLILGRNWRRRVTLHS